MAEHAVLVGPWMNVGIRFRFPPVLAKVTEELVDRDQDRRRTVGADGFDLGARGALGHQALRRNSEVARRPGQSLRRWPALTVLRPF